MCSTIQKYGMLGNVIRTCSWWAAQLQKENILNTLKKKVSVPYGTLLFLMQDATSKWYGCQTADLLTPDFSDCND